MRLGLHFLFFELQDPDAQMVAFFLLGIQRLNMVAVRKLIVLVRTDGRAVPGLYADERSLRLVRRPECHSFKTGIVDFDAFSGRWVYYGNLSGTDFIKIKGRKRVFSR